MLVSGRSDYLNEKSETSSLRVWGISEEGRKLEQLAEVDGPTNPSWVEYSNGVLIATGETDKGGCIFSYSVADGKLIKKGECPVPGAPCHILLSQGCAVIAAYTAGTVTAVPYDEEGCLDVKNINILDVSAPVRVPALSFRQESSHPHEVKQIKDGIIAVSDLGLDCVHIIKQEHSSLTFLSKIECQPGGGPRHIEVDFEKNNLYVLNELLSSITIFKFDYCDKKGISTTEINSSVSLLPENVKGTDAHHRGASEISLSNCRKYLLAVTRTTNEFCVFKIDSDGQLIPFSRSFSGGTTPRHFLISRDLIYVSCHIISSKLHPEEQDTDKVAVFKFNEGELTQLASYECKFASCTALIE